MGVGRAGMEKIMEVPEGTKSGSRLWFSSPTPRQTSTHSIIEQDRCPVWAHLSVRARAHAHARWPARQGVGGASGHNLEISFDIVLAFATRLAPMEVLMCLLLMKSHQWEQCHIFHLGFLCPGCHDIRYRHGFCNKRSLSEAQESK